MKHISPPKFVNIKAFILSYSGLFDLPSLVSFIKRSAAPDYGLVRLMDKPLS
jgi:hypothetical protein